MTPDLTPALAFQPEMRAELCMLFPRHAQGLFHLLPVALANDLQGVSTGKRFKFRPIAADQLYKRIRAILKHKFVRGPVIDSKASVERIDPSVLILIHKRSFLPLSFHVGCGVFQRAYLWTQSHAHRLFVDLLTGR